MARMLTDNTYFSVWISWTCEACGTSDEIQMSEDTQSVIADIDHFCEVDD